MWPASFDKSDRPPAILTLPLNVWSRQAWLQPMQVLISSALPSAAFLTQNGSAKKGLPWKQPGKHQPMDTRKEDGKRKAIILQPPFLSKMAASKHGELPLLANEERERQHMFVR